VGKAETMKINSKTKQMQASRWIEIQNYTYKPKFEQSWFNTFASRPGKIVK